MSLKDMQKSDEDPTKRHKTHGKPTQRDYVDEDSQIDPIQLRRPVEVAQGDTNWSQRDAKGPQKNTK